MDRLITYNDSSVDASYDIIKDDDLFFVENLDSEEKVDIDKNVEMDSRLNMKVLNLMIVA